MCDKYNCIVNIWFTLNTSEILVTISKVEAFNSFSKYKSEVTTVKDAECSVPITISKYKDMASPFAIWLMGWEPHQEHARAF